MQYHDLTIKLGALWNGSPCLIETEAMTPKSPDLVPLIQALGRKDRHRL